MAVRHRGGGLDDGLFRRVLFDVTGKATEPSGYRYKKFSTPTRSRILVAVGYSLENQMAQFDPAYQLRSAPRRWPVDLGGVVRVRLVVGLF